MDKRTSAGWYVLKNAQIGRVNVPESQIQFASIKRLLRATSSVNSISGPTSAPADKPLQPTSSARLSG